MARNLAFLDLQQRIEKAFSPADWHKLASFFELGGHQAAPSDFWAEMRKRGHFAQDRSSDLFVQALQSIGLSEAILSSVLAYRAKYCETDFEIRSSHVGSRMARAAPTKFDLGIICTKGHEYLAFSKLLKAEERMQNISNFGETQPFKDFVYSHFTVNGKNIAVVSFGDVQGPVETASRTVELIKRFELKAIGMVGIAGAERLGDVVVAQQAFTPECGRYSRLANQLDIPPVDGWKYECTRAGHEGWIEDLSLRGNITSFGMKIQQSIITFPFVVTFGPFASFNEVRNDCAMLLTKPPVTTFKCKAIEMEAYALLKAAKLVETPVLAIVKGVSDVGEELYERWKLPDDRSETAKHNNAQIQALIDEHIVLPSANNDNLRKAYRAKAAANASEVMYRLIREWAV